MGLMLMNKIIIKNFRIFAHHGVHQEEKINGQNFYIDAEITTSKIPGYLSDEIEDTLSYSVVMRKMKEIFTKKSYNLLEKCAEVLCDSLLNEYKEIEKIKLTLKKPEAPIKEDFEYVGIEITRNRKEKR